MGDSLLKKNPTVSVVVPVYNGEKYVRQALDSIINQTFQDFELIAVNDGSTDSTCSILKEYAQKDCRIRVLENQSNIGCAGSVNKGLKTAAGRYIAFHDHDDISEPDRFDIEVKRLDSDPELGLVGTGYVVINGHGIEMKRRDILSTYEEIKEKMLKGSAFCNGSVMFKRDVLDTVGFYREQLKCAGDFDFLARVSEKYKVVNIDKYLYRLRRGIPSISSMNHLRQLEEHLLILEFAKERKAKGSDSLDEIDTENLLPVLINRYGLDRREINAFKSGSVMGFYSVSAAAGNYKAALRLWWQAFCLEPRKWKVRTLLTTLFAGKSYKL
jgi:glycosyltransferase involved in cell wall biosynthesis